MRFALAWKFATGGALMLSTVPSVAGGITPTPSPTPTVTRTCLPAPPPPTCGAWSRRLCRDPQCAVGCSCRLLPCVGDCSGDGRVDVAELIQLVGIAQGGSLSDRCPGVRQIPGIGDLVQAVSSALFGCNGPVGYRLLDGSTMIVSDAAGSTPTSSAMTGVFVVVDSEVWTPNTWFELSLTALEFRADDVAVSGRGNTDGCYGTAGFGCLSSLTFEFPAHVYASAAATIDGAAAALSGGGAVDPVPGFPAFLDLELCGAAPGRFVSCEAIRSGAERGWALQLVASRGIVPESR